MTSTALTIQGVAVLKISPTPDKVKRRSRGIREVTLWALLSVFPVPAVVNINNEGEMG